MGFGSLFEKVFLWYFLAPGRFETGRLEIETFRNFATSKPEVLKP